MKVIEPWKTETCTSHKLEKQNRKLLKQNRKMLNLLKDVGCFKKGLGDVQEYLISINEHPGAKI